MSVLRILSILLFLVFTGARAYDILVVFPHEGENHLAVFAPIVKKLVENGNILTVISRYSLNIENATYKEVVLKDPVGMEDRIFSFDDPRIRTAKYFKWQNANVLLEKGLKSCELMFSNPNVQKIIKSRRKFDVILAEYFTGECIHGFHHKFGAPLIGVSSTTIMPLYSRRILEPDNPSYIVNNIFSYRDELSFCERAANFFETWCFKFSHMAYLRDNENLIERYFNMKIPSITTNNNSLLLVSSQTPYAIMSGFIPKVEYIGGIHINASRELPKDIQEFMKKFAYVVYVSMGTMIKGNTFPVKQRDLIIDVCREKGYGLLWKWDGEYKDEIPSHMMVRKWFPQRDILAHTRTVIFISHAGLLSVIEALHYGVPMIALPLFVEQFENARELDSIGIGVTMNLEQLTREDIVQAFSKLMSKEHRSLWKEHQRAFKDRPKSPLDTAVYWIQYAARHKNSAHLRPSVDLPAYYYFLLDIRVFFAVIFSSFVVLLFLIIAMCFHFCTKKKTQNNHKMKRE